jgi:hypothetical protein
MDYVFLGWMGLLLILSGWLLAVLSGWLFGSLTIVVSGRNRNVVLRWNRMTTVNYSVHFPWKRPGAPQYNRPYAEVILHGTQNSPRIWCLVDSGADYTQLNNSFANTAGLNLATAAVQTYQTAAGGSTTASLIPNVRLDVEGKTITDTCLFGNNNTPILGRGTFLTAFDVGFDVNGWMRT